MKRRFSKAYLRALHFYVYEVMERMNLLGWRVEISPQPNETSGENRASVWLADYSREATIHLGKDWHERNVHDHRESIVHELVHLILHNLWLNSDHDLRDQVGVNSWRSFHTVWVRDAEVAVAELTEIITPQMPLPPELGAAIPRESAR